MPKLAISLVVVTAWLTISACTIRHNGDGESKNIEIKSPFFGIKVNNDSKPQETGLNLFPGAKQVDGDGDHHNAHVSIDSDHFGLKVVALTYQAPDSPEKVINFYREDLKRFGKVIECPKGVQDIKGDNNHEIQCSEKGSEQPGKLDLAVGTGSRQRIVAVKPKGSGTEFNLVYVQLRKDEAL